MTSRLGLSIGLLLALSVSTPAAEVAPLLAFPGAEGFGAHATGGRGGEVVRVTNLEDSGPGSFREAVSKPGRVVVFDVGGLVTLKSNVSVASNTTILGQTAPGQGITLYNKAVSFSDEKNIIVRYVRFRAGIASDRGKKSVNISKGENMIFDHCSIEWGRWDSMGCTEGSHDITFQDCIIGEAIDPQRFGAIVDSVTNVTICRTLWINNQSRNPKAKGTIHYYNNVIYNYGGTGLAGGHSAADHFLDAVNNYLIAGPSSTGKPIGGFSESDHVFAKGNMVDLDRDGKLNGQPVTQDDFGNRSAVAEGTDDKVEEGAVGGASRGVVIPKKQKPFPTFVEKPWEARKVPGTLLTAEEAVQHVIAEAGCSLKRDAVDERLIRSLASFGREGKIIKSEEEVGGNGKVEETKASRVPADGAAMGASGYMKVEEWAEGLLKK